MRPIRPANDRVLNAAEQVLRQHGSDRLSVPLVAQSLNLAPITLTVLAIDAEGLRERLVGRSLDRIINGLSQLTGGGHGTNAEARLGTTLNFLVRASRIFQREDPQLFAAYRYVSQKQAQVVIRFQHNLLAHVEVIIASGIKSGELADFHPWQASWATLNAIAPFYDPRFGRDWSAPGEHAAYKHARALIMRALTYTGDAKSPSACAQMDAASAMGLLPRLDGPSKDAGRLSDH